MQSLLQDRHVAEAARLGRHDIKPALGPLALVQQSLRDGLGRRVHHDRKILRLFSLVTERGKVHPNLCSDEVMIAEPRGNIVYLYPWRAKSGRDIFRMFKSGSICQKR